MFTSSLRAESESHYTPRMTVKSPIVMSAPANALAKSPRSANVEAMEACLIAVMPTSVFRSLMEGYPCVMCAVTRLLAATVRSLSERLFELSTLGIQNRVHAEILHLARESGVNNGRATISPAPKHVEIAARVSANREQVAKELSAMARQGLVKKADRALVIPDIARLEQVVTAALR